jgi:hypothetical protein
MLRFFSDRADSQRLLVSAMDRLFPAEPFAPAR